VKAFQTIVNACATTVLLAGCASGLNRSKEEALNQKVGIVVHPARDGVELRLQESALFDFDEASMRPESIAVLNRAAVLLKRSTRPIMV